jgi:hypothetical protein
VTQGLKAGIVEKIKAAIARQLYGEHVSVAINKHATTEEILGAVFPVWSMPRL